MPDKNIESLLSAALQKVKYRNHDQTKRDVLALLHHYRGLIPKQDKFIFNDGSQRDLINIYGTIPVPYKGQNYNIPVSIWLLETHPQHAPICYVKPTPDMQIKVSKHVDHSGKIYLPYLADWARPNSELLGLVQICIVTFSEQPPVYSKPKESPAPAYPNQAGAYYPQPQGQAHLRYPGYPSQYPPSQPYTTHYNQQGSTSYPTYPPTTGYPQEPPKAAGPQPPTLLAKVEEKVRSKLREEISTRHAETETLRQVGESLVQGQGRLQQMVDRIDMEAGEVEEQVRSLKVQESLLGEEIARLEGEGEVVPDSAVVAPSPLHRQILAASAEESATEDAIYFLGEALRRGVIDCETFLRHVRQMSRRQFILRATMTKARRTAGLRA